jgi:integrase
MKRRDMVERPNGFRSSFRDWIAEATNTPHDVAEKCMAHVTGGAVELAYRRTDYLEQRRVLMERWAGLLSQSVDETLVRFTK